MSNPVWSIHQTEAIAILLLTRFIHLFRYNNLDSIHEIYFKKKTFGWYNSIDNNNSGKIRKETLLKKMNKYQKRMSILWGKKWKFCYHKHTNSHSHSFIESQTNFFFVCFDFFLFILWVIVIIFVRFRKQETKQR